MLQSVGTTFLLSLIMGPLTAPLLSDMFYFFTYRFTVLPVLLTVPAFLLLGSLIPFLLYGQAARHSAAERLREAQ